MKTKDALDLARAGRVDLVAENAASLHHSGLPWPAVMRLVAALVARYPHLSGERLSVRSSVRRADQVIRAAGREE
jgi:hypothetical protein